VKDRGPPRISSQATFMEAVDALQKAQEEFSSGKERQRILLVYDEAGQIVGLIRFSDVYKKIAQTMKECPVPA